jgi:8-oxo-dGTP pyrophosphatase MutT (NUDIX family)
MLVETMEGSLGFGRGMARPGESPLQTAERQLMAECGIAPDQLRYLGVQRGYLLEPSKRPNQAPLAAYFVAELLPHKTGPALFGGTLKRDGEELRIASWFPVEGALQSPALRGRRKSILRKAVRRITHRP